MAKKIKTVAVMVSSVNAKTTKGNDPYIYSWTSEEDQVYFFNLLKHHPLLIMGRKTYEIAKPLIQHTKGTMRIVLTTRPERFTNEVIPGTLEFSKENPDVLLTRLEKQGFRKALLLGGEKTNTSFLQANLLDEIWLTIEPVVFGEGLPLFQNTSSSYMLSLLSQKRINKQGTMLIKYRVSCQMPQNQVK